MRPLMYGAALYAWPLVVELLTHCCLRAEALMDSAYVLSRSLMRPLL
jgi:hypothetical protein